MSAVTVTRTTEFEVVNPLGKTIYTAGAKDLANKWAKAETARLKTALVVQEVTREVSVRRRKVYTHKPPAEGPINMMCAMHNGATA